MEQTQIYTDQFFSIALLNGVSPYKNDTQKTYCFGQCFGSFFSWSKLWIPKQTIQSKGLTNSERLRVLSYLDVLIESSVKYKDKEIITVIELSWVYRDLINVRVSVIALKCVVCVWRAWPEEMWTLTICVHMPTYNVTEPLNIPPLLPTTTTNNKIWFAFNANRIIYRFVKSDRMNTAKTPCVTSFVWFW